MHSTETTADHGGNGLHRKQKVSLKDAALTAILTTIENERVQPGTVLLEGPIADRLGMSRVPVRQALKDLARLNKIHKFDGRGYLVGQKGDELDPIRRDLRLVDWWYSEKPLKSVKAVDAIFSALRSELIEIIPFGSFRISEAGLADSYDVSRTVVRQALERLQAQGIVGKDRSSHWIVGPLTAQTTRDAYGLRFILEPEALRLANPSIENIGRAHDRVRRALQEVNQLSVAEIAEIEDDLHDRLLSPIENTAMAKVLEQSRMPMIISGLFDAYLGQASFGRALEEHLMVLEHLSKGRTAEACDALKVHLSQAQRRAISGLKVLSVVPNPEFPSFVRPLPTGNR